MSELLEQYKKTRSIAELDRAWLEYLKLIHLDLERIAKVLEGMDAHGILAYPKV